MSPFLVMQVAVLTAAWTRFGSASLRRTGYARGAHPFLDSVEFYLFERKFYTTRRSVVSGGRRSSCRGSRTDPDSQLEARPVHSQSPLAACLQSWQPRRQRPLWTITGTKDPKASDILRQVGNSKEVLRKFAQAGEVAAIKRFQWLILWRCH